jgi:hypothetical protein
VDVPESYPEVEVHTFYFLLPGLGFQGITGWVVARLAHPGLGQNRQAATTRLARLGRLWGVRQMKVG